MREELRRGTRIVKAGDFDAKVVKAPKNRKLKGLRFSGKTMDVSADGLQIMYSEELPVGTVLKLQLVGAAGGQDLRTFTLKAEVVRVQESDDGFLMGLVLVKCPRGEKELWQEHIYATLRFRGM